MLETEEQPKQKGKKASATKAKNCNGSANKEREG